MKKHNFYCSSIALFLLTILLSSCNLFSVSLEDFFKEYTESAVVEDYELDCPTRTDKFGNICIPSDTDVTFNFLLRNPQNYRDITITYILNNDTSTALSKGPSLTVAQNYADARQADYIWNKTDLVSAEKQNIHDLSGIVSVYRPTTGQTFTEYPFNIHVNSAPPAVKNPTLQLTGDNGTGDYVLCFYLPVLVGTVHAPDTNKITINNTTWYFNNDGSNFFKDKNLTVVESNCFVTTQTIYPLADKYNFVQTAPSGYKTWYFLTDEPYSDSEIKYDITISDDAGLSSSVGISNKGYQLEPVEFQIESAPDTYTDIVNNQSYAASNETAKTRIKLIHSGKTTADTDCGPVEVEYSLTNPLGYSKTGTFIISNSSAGIIEVPFGSNYNIKATAKKSYFIKSDESQSNTFTVSRSNNYYISSSGHENALGTKVDPFRTVQQAIASIDQLETDGVSSYTDYYINLLSDITPDASDYDPDNPNEFAGDDNSMIEFYLDKTIYLNGNGHTIDAQRSVDYPGRVITISNTTIHLKNIKITGGYYSPGSAINCNTANIPLYLETGTIITGNINNLTTGGVIRTNYTINVSGTVKVYDNKYKSGNQSNVYITDNYQLNITGPVTGSKIGITTQTKPRANNEGETNKERVYFATGLNQNSPSTLPSDVFFSDAGFTVGWGPAPVTPGDPRYCALWYSKGTINLEPIADLKITADNTTILKSQNSTAAQRTVTATARVNNQMVSPSSWYMELFCHGTSTGVTSNNNTITLGANWPNDTYTLFVKTVYNGQTYSAEINVDYTNAVVVNNVTEFNNALNSSGIIALSNNITEDTESAVSINYQSDDNQNIGTYHNITSGTISIYGNPDGLVTNTENNSTIHSPEASKIFFRVAGSTTKVVFNNIDFTAEEDTLYEIKSTTGHIISLNEGCEVVLNYCTVKNITSNEFTSSIALFNLKGNSKITLNHCEVENFNVYHYNGGDNSVIIVDNGSSCYMNYCNIKNICHDKSPDYGAAVINNGYMEIDNCTFEKCHSQNAGAIQSSASIKITNCTFTNCHTGNVSEWGVHKGGAIRLTETSQNAEIRNCSFTENYMDESFSNSKPQGGGAIAIESGNVIIDSCTIKNNSCGSLGGSFSSHAYGGGIFITDYDTNYESGGSQINITLKKDNQTCTLTEYINTYMKTNGTTTNKAATDRGKNIYIDKNKTTSILINNQEYTASQAWDD